LTVVLFLVLLLLTVELFLLRLLRMQQHSRRTKITSAARPPTAPPMIGAKFVVVEVCVPTVEFPPVVLLSPGAAAVWVGEAGAAVPVGVVDTIVVGFVDEDVDLVSESRTN